MKRHNKNELSQLVKESREFKRSYNKHQRFTATTCYILPGFLMMFLLIFILITGYDSYQIFGMIMCCIFIGGIATICFIAGVRILKKHPYKRDKKEIMCLLRKITIITITVIFIVSAVIIVYKINEQIDNFTILNLSQYITIHNGSTMGILRSDKYYIRIDDIKKELECNENEYLIMSHHKMDSDLEFTSFEIEYKWNRLFPNKGEIIRLVKQ